MSGGKGGSTTSSVTIPEYIEEAARRNLAKAEGISQIGYVPYYGPDVAAFTPFQQAGFQQTADVASAFGLASPTAQADVMGGMAPPTQYAGGVSGYSAAPMYEQSVAELAARRPAQKEFIDSFFIDPVTGQVGSRVQQPVDYGQYMTGAQERERDRQNQLAVARAESGEYSGPMTMNPNASPSDRDNAMQFHATRMGRGSDNWQTADEIMFQQGKINAAGFPIDAQGNVIVGTPESVAGNIGDFLAGGGFIGAAGEALGILPSTGEKIMTAAGMPPVSIDDPMFAKTPTQDPLAGFSDPDDFGGPGGSSGSYGSGVGQPYEGPAISVPSPAQIEAEANMGLDPFGGAGRPIIGVDTAPIVGKAPSGSNIYALTPSGDGSYTFKGGKDVEGGSAGGGGVEKILCCAYYNLGYLPREIWRLDQRYGVWLHRNDPELMEGYHAWAAPLAEYIQKDTRGAKVARAVMWPIVKAWAAEMAHKQRPEKYKPNVVGKMIMAIGEPFSRVCGMLKPRAIRGEA
jgi:hypothetical protein